MSNDTVYNAVTAQVIELLEAGTVPWHKPWNADAGLPKSLSTGRPYRGLNPFVLAITAQVNGYTSPWWGTYGQIAKRSGMVEVDGRWANPDGDDTERGVRRGEHGTWVHFWKRLTVQSKQDPDGEPKVIMLLRAYRVFSADQAAQVEAPAGVQLELTAGLDPIDACEAVVARYTGEGGPALRLGGTEAFYMPSRDLVCVPELQAFTNAEAYYSTTFHELTHSTAHATRLAREGIVGHHRFGDESYAKEELIAEMGAAMLCGVTGIEQTTVPRSASYIANWLKALKDDRKLIISAAGAAQRASDLILGVTYGASGGDQPADVAA